MRFPWSHETPEPAQPNSYTLATRLGPLPVLLIPKATAFGEWKRRVDLFPETGLWPVLLGPEGDLAEFVDMDLLEDAPETPEQALANAKEVDLEELYAQWLEDLRPIEDEIFAVDVFDVEGGEVEEVDFEVEEEDGLDLSVDLAALDLSQRGPSKPSVVDGTGEEGCETVGLVEIPCSAPWQVFTVRSFGNWNATPADFEITAVLRDWYERFGATPIGLTQDVIELAIANPITDAQLAAGTAVKMYAFCSDIVDQGVGSVHNLAQTILNASVWFFWWD